MIKIRNLNIILLFVFLYLTISTEARRKEEKKPEVLSQEELNAQFEQSIKKYELLKEEKYSLTSEEKRRHAKRSYELKKRSADNIVTENTQTADNKTIQKKKKKVCRIRKQKVENTSESNAIDSTKLLSNDNESELEDGQVVVDEKKYYKNFNNYWWRTKKSTKTKTKTKTTKKAKTTKAKTTKAKTTSKKTSVKAKATTTIKKTSTVKSNTSATVKSSKIYQPKQGETFQWQLQDCDELNTNVKASIYDIDLFDTKEEDIKKLKNKGVKVMCYFSGGTIETWRDDVKDYQKANILLAKMKDWEDEYWLDVTSPELKKLIIKRLDMAVKKGCDGVEIDNVDGYTFDEIKFKYDDQKKFNSWLADAAHERKLSIGLKNDIEQIKDLQPKFDWALNEECFEYGECGSYKPFINNNKAVFGVSYLKNKNKIKEACKQANELKLDYQIKNIDLDASKTDCKQYA